MFSTVSWVREKIATLRSGELTLPIHIENMCDRAITIRLYEFQGIGRTITPAHPKLADEIRKRRLPWHETNLPTILFSVCALQHLIVDPINSLEGLEVARKNPDHGLDQGSHFPSNIEINPLFAGFIGDSNLVPRDENVLRSRLLDTPKKTRWRCEEQATATPKRSDQQRQVLFFFESRFEPRHLREPDQQLAERSRQRLDGVRLRAQAARADKRADEAD